MSIKFLSTFNRRKLNKKRRNVTLKCKIEVKNYILYLIVEKIREKILECTYTIITLLSSFKHTFISYLLIFCEY